MISSAARNRAPYLLLKALSSAAHQSGLVAQIYAPSQYETPITSYVIADLLESLRVYRAHHNLSDFHLCGRFSSVAYEQGKLCVLYGATTAQIDVGIIHQPETGPTFRLCPFELL